ncbi:hypothetical protein MICRO116_860001 [Micrococcus sp. 116]|nr:hypothetical protein MICRO116_860001 [Micrococcus sp. 116]
MRRVHSTVHATVSDVTRVGVDLGSEGVTGAGGARSVHRGPDDVGRAMGRGPPRVGRAATHPCPPDHEDAQ